MTRELAIKLLHPDTTKDALGEKPHDECIKLIEKACVLACEALKDYEPWIPATTPPKPLERVMVYYKLGDHYWTDIATYYKKGDAFWEDIDEDGFYKYDSEYGYFPVTEVLFWKPLPKAPTM